MPWASRNSTECIDSNTVPHEHWYFCAVITTLIGKMSSVLIDMEDAEMTTIRFMKEFLSVFASLCGECSMWHSLNQFS